MKAKIFKIGMPIMVFMLAIVFAFATPTKQENSSAQLPGYIFQSNDCVEQIHTCSLNGNATCRIGTITVYATKAGTVCLNPLMRWE